MKNIKKLWLILSITIISLLISCNSNNISNTPLESVNNTSSIGESLLEIHYLDVGQGDCTILTCDGKSMIIDGGDEQYGSTIKTYLNKQGITTFELAIGTHPDSDHIGSLDVILYNFECKNVIMSKFKKDTRAYDNIITTCKGKNYKINYPDTNTTYSLGSATVTIISLPDGKYNSSNDSSVCLLVEHGSNRFLFTGDAESKAEKDLLSTGIDLSNITVYHTGHHGSSTSSTDKFLNVIEPEYSVISCGENNRYGHPRAETLNKFRIMGIKVFRTDEQGAIIAKSNGKEVTFNMSPSETWISGDGSAVK